MWRKMDSVFDLDEKIQLRVSNQRAYVWDVEGEVKNLRRRLPDSVLSKGQISLLCEPNTTSAGS